MEKELLSSFVTRSKNSSNRKSSAKAEDFFKNVKLILQTGYIKLVD